MFVNEVDHECNSAVVVLMSHGNTGYIYGIDDEKVKIKDIQEEFDVKKCPNLKGKPKLFFIQACRGCKYNYYFTIASDIKMIGYEAIVSFCYLIMIGSAMFFKPGYTCRTTVNFGTLKDDNLWISYSTYGHYKRYNKISNYVSCQCIFLLLG